MISEKRRRTALHEAGHAVVAREPERPRPDDMDRIYWLACFTDDEIAELAYFIFGGGDVEAVAVWRARLTRWEKSKAGVGAEAHGARLEGRKG